MFLHLLFAYICFQSPIIFLIKMTKQEENRKLIIAKYLENTVKPVLQIAKDLKIAETTVRNVIKRYKESLTTNRKPGSGGKKGFRDPKLEQKVVRYAEKRPNATEREMALKFMTSKTTVHRICEKNKLKAFKVQKSTNRTDQQAQRAKTRARKLYDHMLRGENRCIVMDDETYVIGNFSQLPGRSFYRARYRFGVARKFKYQRLSKFPTKYMVWMAICSCGRKSRCYVAKGNMKASDYIKECLEKRLLSFIKSHEVPPVFWPDLASIHYSRTVLDWYEQNEILYVPKEYNPPNCPQLRPIETFWALVKQTLKKQQKISKNAVSFQKYWISATNKIGTDVVKRLMKGLPGKVRRFARLALEDQL